MIAHKLNVGNPHAVTFIDQSPEELGELKPSFNSEDFPEGVNVEFVQMIGPKNAKMRVFERGCGETKSCGTGAVAVAMACTLQSGGDLPASWSIELPGGTLQVSIDKESEATLTGPAVTVHSFPLDILITPRHFLSLPVLESKLQRSAVFMKHVGFKLGKNEKFGA